MHERFGQARLLADTDRTAQEVRMPMAMTILKTTLLVAGFCTATAASSAVVGSLQQSDRIQPYTENPRYWQYRGRPVVLLGGSKDDNLFQLPDLEAHLKLLASVGGNYVRNVMSARDTGNVQPFARRADGRYDLERWNDAYWERFETLMRLAREFDIIVQIEVWDRFDYARHNWDTQPFNPKNNVNYTYEESGFVAKYRGHPARNEQPFFFTTPKQRDNAVVFRYQQRFIDEMLRRSLRYPNVLYCIDNETSGDEAWSAYWAEHIRRRADEAGVAVFVTEMWDDWDLKASPHRRTLDHPRRYDFIEVSQNNHQRGESHWENFQWVRTYLDARPRPINAVKTYGSDTHAKRANATNVWESWRRLVLRDDKNTSGNFGDTQHGTARWWRHLIGGAAGVRFHRPPSGIGLSDEAQRHIRAARAFLAEFDIARATPDAEHALLSQRGRDEAYLTHIAHEAYAVYFPDGGDVRLSVPLTGKFMLKWLNIRTGHWTAKAVVATDEGEAVRLTSPGGGHWLALLSRARENAR